MIALLIRAHVISLLLIAFRVIIDRINSGINRTVGSGFRVRVQGLGFRVWGSGL